MKLEKRKIKYATIFFICWFALFGHSCGWSLEIPDTGGLFRVIHICRDCIVAIGYPTDVGCLQIHKGKKMTAIMGTILYVLFILAFIIHDGEEIAVEHKWLLAHGDALCEKHPKLRRMLNHLRKMNTKAFTIGVGGTYPVGSHHSICILWRPMCNRTMDGSLHGFFPFISLYISDRQSL